MESTRRLLIAVLPLGLVFALACSASDDGNVCDQAVKKLEDCNIDTSVSATGFRFNNERSCQGTDACGANCFLNASCGQLQADGNGSCVSACLNGAGGAGGGSGGSGGAPAPTWWSCSSAPFP